ncbi:MAG: NAD(P)/FAD-dependent oxidoreductase [Proteobacteria bacterium]|nr:NAD(P)/FAD-dependent oxidoreductase [Pseudomonadota bacterium]
MNDTVSIPRPASASHTTHVDVLIVGAGISGVGAAYHLTQQCPGTSFAVLEMFDNFGGTWWSHRYPGIRSDSDLHTFGYRFKPWRGHPIATAEEILRYMGEVIEENDLARYIHYRHKVLRASWCSEARQWTIQGIHTDTQEPFRYSANFLFMCQGYYRHQQGYMPDWPGKETFKGTLVHTEEWPEDLDYKDKTVICIGSGATAATVVPAMAGVAKHVTVLQRSPTYFRPHRNAIELAEELRRLQVDEAWVHEITRRKILYEQDAFTKRTFSEPEKVREELLAAVQAQLPEGFDMSHFTPRYRPWQQRLAVVPDGDLFQGIRAGLASVVTDEIERFDETGIWLKSGKHLEADIIMAATGFNLCALGDIAFTIDDKPLNFHDTVTYRGMMFTGVPNMVWVFGYFRASWTLRSDLLADFVCRLLNHMKAKGYRSIVPALRPEDKDEPLLDWLDPDNFNPGYMQRGMHLLPRRLNKPEWMHTQDYWREKDWIPAIDLDDPIFQYGT